MQVRIADGMNIHRHVGRRVKKLRRGKGWSQEKLGFESGFHRTYISQVERGATNPTLDSLKRIADTLAVPCWELIEPM